MLSCLVVQPFLLAMPADACLAIKAQNKCSEFTWVLLFSKVIAQYIILVNFLKWLALVVLLHTRTVHLAEVNKISPRYQVKCSNSVFKP